MSYKIAIVGEPNSGKSYSRKTIKDGENVFILQPSIKASHLTNSAGQPVGEFDIVTAKTVSLADAKLKKGYQHDVTLIKDWNQNLDAGKITKDMVKGTVQHVKEIADLPHWLEFISKHLPWIHTVILADFTHYISGVISTEEFISRKMGGEAYQRFWELAGEAVQNFIIKIDNYRKDMIVVTEYHADYTETGQMQLYTPAGKMLTEKFKPESYYDVFLCTDVKVEEDKDGNVTEKKYRFVVTRTKRYPHARAMEIFGNATFVENDLANVLAKVREYLGSAVK